MRYVNIDRAGALRTLAAQAGPDQDAVVRALGELDAYTNAIKALGVRETIRLLDGQSAGPASSIAKVATSIMLRRTFKATLELAGPLAMVERVGAGGRRTVPAAARRADRRRHPADPAQHHRADDHGPAPQVK